MLDFDAGAAQPGVLVLDLHHVINVDTTGLESLETLHRNLARRGATLLLCDVNQQPASLITRAGFINSLGVANLLPDLPAAIERARILLASAATVQPLAPTA